MPATNRAIRREELSQLLARRRRKRAIAILARFRSGFYQTKEGIGHVHRDAKYLIDYDSSNLK